MENKLEIRCWNSTNNFTPWFCCNMGDADRETRIGYCGHCTKFSYVDDEGNAVDEDGRILNDSTEVYPGGNEIETAEDRLSRLGLPSELIYIEGTNEDEHRAWLESASDAEIQSWAAPITEAEKQCEDENRFREICCVGADTLNCIDDIDTIIDTAVSYYGSEFLSRDEIAERVSSYFNASVDLTEDEVDDALAELFEESNS